MTMAEVRYRCEIFLTERANVRTLPFDLAFRRGEKSTKDPKQTGFAAAVWSGELNERSGRHCQIESAKEPAISTHASELTDL